MLNKIIVFIHTIIPHHLLSRFVGLLAHSKIAWIKNPFIKWFVKAYAVDLSAAIIEEPTEYESFNAFFTRALKPGQRPIDSSSDGIVSPADGAVSQLGVIENGQLIQAKGIHYELLQLLGGDKQHAEQYQDGKFMTIYLAPKDYHRVHMPISGVLQEMVYVPGRIFSVNKTSTEHVPNLFVRNERVICRFTTEYGMMTLVLVGAMIVASIKTVWEGVVAPYNSRTLKQWQYPEENIRIEKGQEMGRFQLGSTVIVLMESKAQWGSFLKDGSGVKMGQKIGQFSDAG